MSISFGLFDHLDARDEPVARTFDERIETIKAAEAAGFRNYHLAEHHSTPLGMGPSPSVFLAAVSRATSKIRLGPLVYLLPLYNPLRLTEEICMLDHLSHGRLEVGVGRGVSPIELGFFGVNADDSGDITNEALEVIRQGLGHERLNHRGHYFQFEDVPMSISPYQESIPFWVASMSPQGLQKAANEGMHSALLGSCEMVKEAVQTYRDNSSNNVNDKRQGMLRLIVVADSHDKAEALGRAALANWFTKLNKLWLEYKVEAPLIGAMGDFDLATQVGAVVVGTPAEVADNLQGQIAETGVNHVLAQMAFGDLPHADEMRSLQLFAEQVMPQLH